MKKNIDYGDKIKKLAQEACDRANKIWRLNKAGAKLSKEDEDWLKITKEHNPSFFVFATTGKLQDSI